MNERGRYGTPSVGAAPGGSSLGKWIIGGLVVGGAALWVKHQSDQIEKLYKEAGLPYQSFGSSLRARGSALSSAASERLSSLSRRLRSAKSERPAKPMLAKPVKAGEAGEE